MDLIVERVDVWAASIKDELGGLGYILTGLKEAGADLDFVIGRRAPEKPGTGVVFVTPLRGDRGVRFKWCYNSRICLYLSDNYGMV